MGHRLLAFIEQALPQHPEYQKSSAASFRAQAALDLEWIQDKVQDIALKIDEEQLNLYITMDFDPQPEDDSTISSAEADFSNFADFSSVNVDGWEDFTNWAFQPSAVETDTSSSLNTTSGDESSPGTEPEQSYPEPIDDPEITFELVDSDEEEDEPEIEQLDLPKLPLAIVQFNDDGDDDTDDNDSAHYYRYHLNDARTASSFLKRISKEDVHYETDSEAVDSWAQDGDAGSRASSGTAYVTYDPARLAFREIMNRVQLSGTPPPPPNSPSDIENRKAPHEDEGKASDRWAAFDFASVRQSLVN